MSGIAAIATSGKTFERAAFVTSRELEYFTRSELTKQIGYDLAEWPIALVKELIDNGLDECESAGIAPMISVTLDRDRDLVTVADNGRGIPSQVITDSLNYRQRVSTKSRYVSPTRGQLGNALKCLWAAPFVAGAVPGHSRGQVEITALGRHYLIQCSVDAIAQRPRVTVSDGPAVVKNGTSITFGWPQIASCLAGEIIADSYKAATTARELIGNYSAFNPHASFSLDGRMIPASDPTWRKWRADQPTSAHWYSLPQFRDLAAAYLSRERDGGRALTVREFVALFDGFAGSAKQKEATDAAGLTGKRLSALIDGDKIDDAALGRLWCALCSLARKIGPSALGRIGREHLARFLVERWSVEPETIEYRRFEIVHDLTPYHIEIAFGIRSVEGSSIAYGLNFAPLLREPSGYLTRVLGEARVERVDPVAVIIHIATPKPGFTDHGKTQLCLPPSVERQIADALRKVTTKWTRIKRNADKEERARERLADRLAQWRRGPTLTAKDAAFMVMKDAYLQASHGGRLPANARQIMYAARPHIIDLTGNPKALKNTDYFTQTLLPDYLEQNPEETAGWDVVFDARGHLSEPHTGRRISLGTVEVREYSRDWFGDPEDDITLATSFPTLGPKARFSVAMFIEKEGFDHLWKAARLQERYDLAIFSTKGMPVTAARQLIEKLSENGVRILCLHDFDQSGLRMPSLLKNSNRRYQYKVAPNVIDLGVRLADVREYDLAPEDVAYRSHPINDLRSLGASDPEIAFLVNPGNPKVGRRVEINAFVSSGLILEWLEAKFAALGMVKLIPDEETMQAAWDRVVYRARLQRVIDESAARLRKEKIPTPDDLAERIGAALNGRKDLAWDQVLAQMAQNAVEEGGTG